MPEGDQEAHIQEVDIRVILDSNVWIAYIKCREVAHRLFEELERARAQIVVPGIILEEVWRNIAAPRGKAGFMAALLSPRVLVLAERVPERLARKYSRYGLGNGDHVIAAFAWLTQIC